MCPKITCLITLQIFLYCDLQSCCSRKVFPQGPTQPDQMLFGMFGSIHDLGIRGGGAQWETFGLYVEMAYLYILVHFWSTNMIAVMKADELSIHITL